LKKTLLYLLAAAILGILVTVVPLITVVKFTTVAKTAIGGSTQLAPQPRSIGQGLKQLEGGSGLNSSQVNISDLTVLAISIIIALLAYTLVRRERGHGLES
jgi:hypothetical protein